jgi:thiol-disulfide isomerase/thioredoxin
MAAFFMALMTLFTAWAAAEPDFKTEYEALNGQTAQDGVHQYKALDFPDDALLNYVSFEDAMSLINDGTGVLYLGFPECPWCRTLLPALVDAVKRAGYEGTVSCYNALDQRDVMSLDSAGRVVTEKEAAPEYAKLRDALYDYLGPYDGLNDPSIHRIYFPTTVFVRNGEILSVHLGTEDDQKSGYDALSPELYEQLVGELTSEIEAVKK